MNLFVYLFVRKRKRKREKEKENSIELIIDERRKKVVICRFASKTRGQREALREVEKLASG